MVAYLSCIFCTDSATRRGSSRSSGCGLPVSIWQKSHRRVHWSPPMRKVASRSSQHSKMLGQPASWQTVWSPSDFTRFCREVYSGPILARVLIHSGLRSIGVSALRISRRRSLRPSGAGAVVTRLTLRRRAERPQSGCAAPQRGRSGLVDPCAGREHAGVVSTSRRRFAAIGNRIGVLLHRVAGGRLDAWGDTTVLMITSPGRRTGVPRSTMVRYLEHDGGYLVWGTGS